VSSSSSRSSSSSSSGNTSEASSIDWMAALTPDSILFPLTAESMTEPVHAQQDSGEWLKLFNAFIDPASCGTTTTSGI
jgi:hypothetical protein